ncbi:lipoprotein releasing system, transmembrane protein, LolC/E family [secondary endosymbiont of Heteropsylla cubana]|uniref:Lipoprotein releasing system, transmembrane protein, LolC/E family n=1 Tax=secondary endosymbiont of Heteropsylla cubana TaxID=134287 RepID=J3YTM3_9ENTR|nr:lipoprotein-releasing ABC transporter permease subunit LolE [secondary endosymbiont of Heteropsylla cubana]AFP85813.1 lipoprotein releasing system, transmembrane protein, LolC/E family [secondary endosymbiont of Heteropsylla cubana]
MNIPLSLRIAIRFCYGQQKGFMLSLVSVISVMGIGLGVCVLIVGLSAMNGFNRELNNRILSIIPHGQIEPINPPFFDWKEALKRIKQLPGILGVSPYLNFSALVEYNNKFQAVEIKGIQPEIEIKLNSFHCYSQENAWTHFHSGQQKIILGGGVANTLKVKAGDWVTIITPNNNSTRSLVLPQHIQLQVSGILSIKSHLDQNIAIIPLEDAQHYLHRYNDVGGLAIKVIDVFNAEKIVHDAGAVIHNTVKIRSWISTHGYISRDIQIIRIIIYIAMLLVIGVACFNIVSILVMSVNDKRNDIAILRSLGAKDGLITSIFIWYGLLASLIGSFFGAIFGVLTALNLTKLVELFELFLGQQLLSSNIYFIDFLPTELHWVDVSVVLITVILLTLLASWYPARRASCIDPVKILIGQFYSDKK